jgi:hypothetical protein
MNANGLPSPMSAFQSKKSPSFHSNKSENMSVDGGGLTLPTDEGFVNEIDRSCLNKIQITLNSCFQITCQNL